MSVKEILNKAISGNKTIKIVYNGGSQPGSIREIVPRSISNDKVKAMCLKSKTIKTFVIKKIEIADDDQKGEAWKHTAVKKDEYSNLQEFCNLNLSTLENLGWVVNIGESSISLHRTFKNGNPLKSADVMLDYDEFTYLTVFNDNDEVELVKDGKRQRPWSVSAKNFDTRTYGNLSNALHIFLEQANILSPKK